MLQKVNFIMQHLTSLARPHWICDSQHYVENQKKKKKSYLHAWSTFALLFLSIHAIQTLLVKMSYSSSIPTWAEENRILHDTICQARVSKDSAAALRQILHIHKEKFLMLLDSEPKNAQHRAMLNSSMYLERTVMSPYLLTQAFLRQGIHQPSISQCQQGLCHKSAVLVRPTEHQRACGSNLA